MADLSLIEPGFQVFASDGDVVGIVDDIEGGERIRLRVPDKASTPHADFIPSTWVQEVTSHAVRLNRTYADAQATMNDEIPAGDSTS